MPELFNLFLSLQYERWGFEMDGYKLINKYEDVNEKVYEYLHTRNSNSLQIVCNVPHRFIKIYKNGKLVKEIEV